MGINVSYQEIYQCMINVFLLYLGVALLLILVETRLKKRLVLKESKSRLLTFTLALGILLTGYGANRYGAHCVKINEVCSKQFDLTETEETTEDYIELYNAGRLLCCLDNMYLSDDPENLNKYALTGIKLKGREYLAVEVGDSTDGMGEFKINRQGETIYLSDAFGNILDQVEVPALEENTAFARVEDGKEQWKVKSCTKGETNEGSFTQVEEPVFSAESGFYQDEFNLEITAEENTKIFYTLYGSIPDKESYLYKKPIRVTNRSSEKNVWNSVRNVVSKWKKHTPDTTLVDKAFIIRAVAMDKNGNYSDVVTRTYFVDLEEYRDRNVLSMVTDPNDMFGEDGIHVTGKEYDTWYENGKKGKQPTENFQKRGREWEIPASIELFQNNLVLDQEAGVRIQGGSTRVGAKKRFSIYSRKEYSGDGLFETELFPDKKSHSVMLRDSFANVFCQDLVKDREIAIQRGIPVTLFLNGEYWYDTYIQERYSDTYIEYTYGVNKDDVVIVHDGYLEEGVESDIGLFGGIYAYYSTHDLSKEEEYQGFGEIIDIQSYIDYMVANIYMCNMDMSEAKNCLLWRSRKKGSGYSDGRWRWMMYDVDSVEWNDTLLDYYGVETAAEINTFTQEMFTAPGSYNTQGTFVTLKQNENFCRQFVNTFMDMVNTTFSIENVEKKLNEWGEDLTWEDSFFVKRPEYILSYLEEEFALEGTLEDVTVSVNDAKSGEIQVNTAIPELEGGTWTGQYYTDYPITMEAKPQKGYEFVRWRGAVNSISPQIEVPVEERGVEIYAEFRKVEK